MLLTISSISKKTLFGYTLILSIGILSAWNYFKSRAYQKKQNKIKDDIAIHIQNRNQKIKNIHIPEISSIKKEIVLNSTINQLKNHIVNGNITCQELVYIYIERCNNIGLKYKFIADVNYEEALKIACNNDELVIKLLNENNFNRLEVLKALPHLFGIPFSIKESLRCKGMNITHGFSLFNKNPPSKTDSVVVEILKEAGAIPLISSNTPQGIYSIITRNPIWGDAINPWQPEKLRTTGGSSGGEAGLVSTKCVQFGIGVDGAGSLRVPSCYCGTFCFKPTAKRMSKIGQMTIDPRSDLYPYKNMEIVIGPSTRYPEDLQVIMEVLFDKMHKKDYETAPIKYNKEIEKMNPKLKIGYFKTTKLAQVCQSFQVAVDNAIQILINKGHEVLPIDFEEIDHLNILANQYRGRAIWLRIKRLLGNQPCADSIQYILNLISKPPWQLKLLAKYEEWKGNKRNALFIRQLLPTTLEKFLNNNYEMENVKRNLFSKIKNMNLDGIICPVISLAPLDIESQQNFQITNLASLTHFGNILDMPAGVVPVSLINQREEYIDPHNNNDDLSRYINKVMKDSIGFPTCVQVITNMYEDELCLYIMKLIDEEYQFTRTQNKL